MSEGLALIPDPKAVKSNARLYRGVMSLIRKDLMGLSMEGWNERKAAGIQARALQRIAALDRAMRKRIPEQVRDTYARSLAVTRVHLLALDYTGKEDPKIHRKAVVAAAALMIADITKANASMRRTIEMLVGFSRLAAAQIDTLPVQEFGGKFQKKWGDLANEWLADLMRTAVAEKWSRRPTQKALDGFLSSLTEGGKFVQIDGRYFNAESYAEMTSRTRFREAQSNATRNIAQEYGDDLVQISEHGTESEICEAYEGNVYSLTGSMKGYPLLDQDPPFHPNCMHSMFPTSEVALSARGG